MLSMHLAIKCVSKKQLDFAWLSFKLKNNVKRYNSQTLFSKYFNLIAARSYVVSTYPKDICINNRKEHLLHYCVSSIISIDQRVMDDHVRMLCWIWIDHLVEVTTVLSGCLGGLFSTVHDGGHNGLSFVHE